MAKTIIQSVAFKNVSAKQLYETYMDSKKHAAAIGAEASIQNKVGGTFSVWDGMLEGKNLLLIKDKMIVQTWRSTAWDKTDEDSILTFRIEEVKGGARMEMVHAFVPDHDYEGIKEGWPTYYWKPWKAYFKK
jgi:activator of HSP90 ATPase